jgi:hypothetical protein
MASINVLASQAKCINLCKNLRTEVVKCCANIYFSGQCLAANENFHDYYDYYDFM